MKTKTIKEQAIESIANDMLMFKKYGNSINLFETYNETSKSFNRVYNVNASVIEFYTNNCLQETKEVSLKSLVDVLKICDASSGFMVDDFNNKLKIKLLIKNKKSELAVGA